MKQEILHKLSKFMEWLTLVGLLIWAGFFVREVWQKYQSYDRSFKVFIEEKAFMDHPTTTLCFQPFAKVCEYEYLHSNPNFYAIAYSFGQNYRRFPVLQ